MMNYRPVTVLGNAQSTVQSFQSATTAYAEFCSHRGIAGASVFLTYENRPSFTFFSTKKNRASVVICN